VNAPLQTQELTWQEVRVELSEKLRVAALWGGTIIIDNLLLGACILPQFLFERLEHYFPITTAIGGYELLALRVTLFTTTMGTGMFFLYRDFKRLLQGSRQSAKNVVGAR
jgi:hypothetical protein